MTEPEPTGYGDSPDTRDNDADDAGQGEPGGAPLTTDDEAQQENAPVRPGNEPD
jgi:hypothetical protein